MISNFSETKRLAYPAVRQRFTTPIRKVFSRKMPIHDLIRPSLGLARAVFTGQSQYAVGHLGDVVVNTLQITH